MPELVHPSLLDPRLTDLQRPEHTGFTGGLCRAVAQRWQVDPLIVRLAAVALALAGGLGIAIYAWGCLLTPRVGGQPPILRWVPAFGRWLTRTQALVVAISSLVLVLSIARQTGVAWGPVIIVAAVAWAVARKRRGTADVAEPASPPDQSGVSAPAPRDGESVEQWRARLGTHAGSVLPTVDLYAPEPPPPSALALDEQPASRTSWWAALAIVALTGAAASIPFALGLSPSILWAFVAAAATSAVLLLGWAIVARRRRLPGTLLALALAGAVGTSLLAVTHSQASTLPLDTAAGGSAHYSFVGEAPAELDLTGLPADTAATVTIDATASVVRVRLAAPPSSVTVNTDTTRVDDVALRSSRTSGRSPRTTSQIDLVIDGDFSVIGLEVGP